MKRIALYALAALFVVGCSAEKPEGTTPPPTNDTKSTNNDVAPTGLETPKSTPTVADANLVGATASLGDRKPENGEEVAVIDTKFGRIVVRFYADKAPKHVENFKQLAKKGFYDGTKFHRIIPGFMIQGGDPNSKDADTSDDGMGGPGYMVDAEFNEVTHERGILSMARSSDPNSAGSQFFIVHAPSYNLDTQYTVFGRVVHDGTEKRDAEPNGLKVVDKIVMGKADGDKAVDPVAVKVSIQKWPIK